MIGYGDILKAVNGVLARLYPDIPRYSNENADSARPTYFFVEIIPLERTHESKNLLNLRASVKITYVQRTPNQADNLRKEREIFDALGMVQRITDADTGLKRALLVRGYGSEYIGEEGNILQIGMRFAWSECTTVESGLPAMERLEGSIERKEH